jgi:hypothetical protein
MYRSGPRTNMDELKTHMAAYAGSEWYVPIGAPANMDALGARVARYHASQPYVAMGAPANMEALADRVSGYGTQVRRPHSSLARLHPGTPGVLAPDAPVADRWDMREWMATIGIVSASLLALGLAAMVGRSRRTRIVI